MVHRARIVISFSKAIPICEERVLDANEDLEEGWTSEDDLVDCPECLAKLKITENLENP